MPKTETAEQKKQRKEAKRRKLSQRLREHRYNRELLMRAEKSTTSFGRESFKYSKEIISERIGSFMEKYLLDSSDFQKRMAYLRSNLTEEEFAKTPEGKMEAIVNELLVNGVQELNDYASITEMRKADSKGIFSYVSANNRLRKKENQHLVNAMRQFEKIEKELDALLQTEFGMSTAFNEFYADVKGLSEETKSIVDGGLRVPQKDEEDALFIKLTKTVKDPETGQDVDVIDEPETLEVFVDPTRKVKPEYISMRDYPLFAHQPCPEDIRQGQIGDCYLIATMSAIAENNPDFIRNMMKDNHDGTVTVRLFDESSKPVYVTVNKTMPVVERDGYKLPAYANGALWVSILEKAYVQSGVVYGNSENFSMNRYTVERNGKIIDNRNAYKDIVGGHTQYTTEYLLGNYTNEIAEDMSLDIPRGGEGTGYTPEELDFFEKIDKQHRRGDALTAGISEYEKKDGDRAYESHAGLPGGHAYTVIGVAEKNGKKFIRVRNPHMSGGRGYDRHGIAIYVENPEVPGESLVELRDFTNTFDKVYAASYSESSYSILQNKLKEDNQMMYGDAIKQACEEILDSDAWYVLNNSESFRTLKKAAIALQSQYEKNPDPQKVEDKLNDLFEAARTYKNDRDNRKPEDAKDANARSKERYRLAEAIGHFENIYRTNKREDTLEYVDFDMCKELALDIGLEEKEMTSAKKAALEEYVKSEATINKDERIQQVEEAGLSKIEEGLKQYNTGKLKEGLMEVLLSRSARLNKDKMRPEDVDRQLSPEAIERANVLLGSKIETALKSIDKKEFLDIMKSGKIGDSMAQSVGKHLKESTDKKRPEAKQEEVKERSVKSEGPAMG